ncbi:MAG TPA: YdcF family protein [Gammaproteobacteria bacterium]|nr:YdcF family protein [Chromatiales bacterium]HOP17648.1 YdcF family protein [Gammaproteobacteria bacterium]
MELDVGTRAILKMAVLPPGSLLILLLLGWLFARRFIGRFLILLGILGFYALSTPVGVNWLATQLETVPAPTPAQIQAGKADAILVLMAGVRRFNPELDGADALSSLSLERIDHGLALYRRTGLPLILSGGSVKGDTTPLADLGAQWLQERAGVTVMAVDNTSRDTAENARNSAELLRARGLRRVLLVTHAFHMPRALLQVRAAGIDAVPAPFGFMHTPPASAGPDELADWLPQAGNLGRSYLVLHEMAGLAWYGLTHQ